jgi:hypothetical protein
LKAAFVSAILVQGICTEGEPSVFRAYFVLVPTLLSFLAVSPVAASFTGPASPRGSLDCSGAVEVQLNQLYTGDNTGLPNNVGTYGCSSWHEPGGEYVFHLQLGYPAVLNAYITSNACDQDLILLEQCDANLGCIGVYDGQFTETLAAGDYYIVVDGQECPFDILFEELFVPWPCLTAQPLDCTDQELSGTTCVFDNSVADLSCAGQPQPGWDYWYEVRLESGGGFSAMITMATDDAALWLLATCAFPPYVCRAFADESGYGQLEVLSYINESSVDETVYLVVDSRTPGGCAAYSGVLNCTGPIAATGVSWGNLKERYR